MNINNRNQQQEERVPFRLTLEEPMEFRATSGTYLVTSTKLSEMISNMFIGFSNDFEGCTITASNHGPELKLYFSNNGGGHVLPKGVASPNATLGDRINLLSNINNNKTLEISTELRDIITQFSFKQNGKVNVDRNINEIMNGGVIGNRKVFLCVSGIDLNEILKVLYGNKVVLDGETLGRALYRVTVIKPLQMAGQGQQAVNYLLSITRYDEDDIARLAKDVGLVQQNYGIPMVKATV